ncbi:ATP-binding protein [Micromonospora endolithica]|uniref:NACHT domain-containing protein n=1 Tax=Micromonospora endolithica TaxID=230091 RepID=A0A3A9ZGU0_9ACTN|nr:ATP-binding protein [Micromonospora endolithica]RKN47681.1 hypothetical protein D7223_13080 [Micromonospora endolithica]TWJ21352.1 hypothetical protein JD76_01462 [Micromonospora endolithica]
MRGPLWRGWLWTPRTWVAMTFRRTATWFQGRSQEHARLQAARPAAPARWWHRPWWWYALAAFTAVVLMVWVLTQFVLPLWNVWLDRRVGFPPTEWVHRQLCSDGDGEQCRKIAGFFATLFPLPILLAVFYLFTRGYVEPAYLKIARRTPEELVTTSNDVLADVIGRDELCEVLVERVRDPGVRCPMVLVGGVGAGKSAILLRLTHELARRGVVPIVLRVRDLDFRDGLDFEKAARQHFTDFIDPFLYSGAQGDRLWRQLRWSNQIAVLADGLEELGGTGQYGHQGQYDSVLRDAFTRAAHHRLPLIAATRPYDPLRSMPAVIVELEPLSESHALAFGLGDDQAQSPESAVLTRLINDADATESPLYLKVIRDLNRYQHLPEELGGDPGPRTANHPADRSMVRLKLLHAWRQAIEQGYVCEDFAHNPVERRHVLDVVAAFACIGLLQNSLSVSYDHLTENGDWTREGHPYHVIFQKLEERVADGLDVRSRVDLVTAVTTAGEFSVVGLDPEGLRFQHGVIQAFLAEQFLTESDVRQKLLPELIRDEPSHESLIALTLLSRENDTTDALNAHLVDMLKNHANHGANKCWRLEMYAAALEIGCAMAPPRHTDIVIDILSKWSDFHEGDVGDRPLDEAKVSLVRRWGDTARLVTDDHHRRPARHGGSRLHGAAVFLGRRRHAETKTYRSLYQLAARESSYRVRLAAAKEIGLGGRPAAHEMVDGGGLRPLHTGWTTDDSGLWERQLRGWVVPLLHLSTLYDVGDPSELPPETDTDGCLREWLKELAAGTLCLYSEIALAQGFRLAANVRSLPRGRPIGDRSALVEKAEFALTHSRFWYSHLVLIQALTLFSLPIEPGDLLPARGHGANPVGLVQHWLAIASSGVPNRERCTAHPFLLAAGRLCVSALITRQPERFCWIDEDDTAGRVGACSPSTDVRRVQRLWIPDSMGWSVLEPRAERLLADVMLLLNLADRGDSLVAREERLRRADRCDLPPCLTADRRAMEPERSVHGVEACAPGATCLDDCPFRLCPLPAKGEPLPHRLDQNFSARQADLATLRYLLPARAPWQSVPRTEMRRFWRQMSWRDLPRFRRW